MAPAQEFLEYHVVDENTLEGHVLNGGDCPCEPRCTLASDSFRIFLHETSRLKIKMIRHKVAPKWWDAK